MTLLEFTAQHRYATDKIDLGYIDYFYNRVLSPRKDQVKNVLEIGIWGGESILLWRDYFSNANIIGADINSCAKLENQDRITQLIGNAYTSEFLNQFEKEYFDVIIDDGPHTMETMSYFLTNHISLLKKGGILILEDIIDRNWTPELLKLIDNTKYKVTTVDMRYLQKTVWLLDRWKNGLDVIIVESIEA